MYHIMAFTVINSVIDYILVYQVGVSDLRPVCWAGDSYMLLNVDVRLIRVIN